MGRLTKALLALAALGLVSAEPAQKKDAIVSDEPAEVKEVLRAYRSRTRLDARGNISEVDFFLDDLRRDPALGPALSRLRHVTKASVQNGANVIVPSHVKNWPELKSLILWRDATDATLTDIETLKNLRQLHIPNGGTITDKGVKSIGKLTNLEELQLTDSEVTDGGMKDIASLPKLRWLDLSDDHITDASLKLLKGKQIERLYLGGTRVTDRGIDEIKDMKSLRYLDVMCTKVTNASLDKLKGIPGLEILGLPEEEIHEAPDDPSAVAAIEAAGIDISKFNITDNVHSVDAPGKRQNPPTWMKWLKGLHSVKYMRLPNDTQNADLKYLAGMTSLESLEVGGDFSEDGMKAIGTLTNLKKLWCGSTPGITSQAMKYLAPLVKLEDLDMAYDPIGDDALRYFAGMKKLKKLSLNNTKVTNAGLVHLKQLPALEDLYVIDTAVTGDGLKNLRGLTKLFAVNGVTASREEWLRLKKDCPKLRVPEAPQRPRPRVIAP
jgi:Leucine-rich repeat (LRR) protein